MRRFLSIAILVVAGHAAAQPAETTGGPPEQVHGPMPPVFGPAPATPARGPQRPAPRPMASTDEACRVTILRAPDDVRRAIESWIGNEVGCKISLEIRVVRTDGGLYLLAREPSGRLHERMVPDAEAAGVLVASWVANDAIGAASRSASAARAGRCIAPLLSVDAVRPAPRIAALDPPEIAVLQPGPNIAVLESSDDARAQIDCRGDECSELGAPALRLSFGVMALPDELIGVRLRAEADVVRRGGFGAGIMLSAANTSREVSAEQYLRLMTSRLDRIDMRGLAGVSWSHHGAGWELRGSLSAGVAWSVEYSSEAGDWLALAVEVSGTVARKLSDAWEIGLTPVATWFPAAWPSATAFGVQADEGLAGLLEIRLRL